MNKLLIILITIALLIVIVFFVLGFVSKKGQALGLKEGQLQACTSTDNCVISEIVGGQPSTIEPFSFNGDKNEFIAKLESAVKSLGGEIVSANETYIATTFTSSLFGFVDDVEFRITEDNLLHFRSCSRVGRKDFGANKKRIDALKLLLK
jgi:uncharacterized protein (DUF1499 family)